MAKSLPKPDFEYLLRLRTELEDAYRTQDDQIRDARRVREMLEPALAEADSKYILVHVDPRDPAVADEGFRTSAALSLHRPTLTVVAGKESDAAATNATEREHFTESILWALATRKTGSDTLRDLTDFAANDGGAWSKLVHDRSYWDTYYAAVKKGPGVDEGDGTDENPGDKPEVRSQKRKEYDERTEDEKKNAGPCFRWVAVDPLTIYPRWSGDDLQEVLEVSERPHYGTLRDYRLGRDKKGNIVKNPRPEDFGEPEAEGNEAKRFPSTVVFFEHWDREWATYAVCGLNLDGKATGQIVKQFKHGYGFIPYDFAPGLWMGFFRNRKVGWGVSQTKVWLAKYQQYLRAMHAQYVARGLLTPLVREGSDQAMGLLGQDGNPLDTEEGPMPGEILTMAPGVTLKPVVYTDPSTLEKHMALVANAIEKLESPRVNSLGGLQGAGFAISQVLSYESVRTGPVKSSLEQMLVGVTRKLWNLIIHKVGERVWTAGGPDGWLGLGPDDLKAPVRELRWEVRMERATDDLVKVRTATERLNNKTWGLDEAIEYLGSNPDEIRRSLLRDKIRNTQEYEAYAKEIVFKRAGRGDLLTKAERAKQLAQRGVMPGMPPGGMVPPGMAPGMMPPGMPMGMGDAMVPDMGNLAMSPQGVGAAPIQGPGQTGPVQVNGNIGMPATPTQSVAGGMQKLF